MDLTKKHRGPIPGSEKARNGGLAVLEKYGREFLGQIGREGGKVVKERYGSEFYVNNGRKGGQKTKERGSDFYKEIGRKGGSMRGTKKGESANN